MRCWLPWGGGIGDTFLRVGLPQSNSVSLALVLVGKDGSLKLLMGPGVEGSDL